MDDPFTDQDANAAGPSDQRIRQPLSSTSLVLGVCALVAYFSIPLLLAVRLSDANAPSCTSSPDSRPEVARERCIRLEAKGDGFIAFAPPGLMLAGIVVALVARKRGEPRGATSTALCWNTLLLLVYAALLLVVIANPVTPT
jgi:hypothetical protein